MDVGIADLSGKYYGTKVIYGNEHEITIWTHDKDFTPSTRQLAYWELTLDEAKDSDMMCDSHYETQEDYDIAVKICYALRDDSEKLNIIVSDKNTEILRMRKAIGDLLECPYQLDLATIPNKGIESAPEQVVGTMSVAWIKRRALIDALK
jgi:hypothetical protein